MCKVWKVLKARHPEMITSVLSLLLPLNERIAKCPLCPKGKETPVIDDVSEKQLQQLLENMSSSARVMEQRGGLVLSDKEATKKKLQADKELNKGIIHGQSEVIDDLRSQLETPINFDPEDDE